MPVSSSEPYWLGRASDEQKRLLKQHTIWTHTQKHRLPAAPIRHCDTARKCTDRRHRHRHGHLANRDVGGLAPSYTFHGFDISSEQFLPAASLPPNVTLGYGDFKNPMPADLRGTFDLVNIRLIIISLGPEAVWKEVLCNVLALLKPGGAVSWTEGNFLVARGFRGGEVEATPGHHLTRGQVQLNSTLVERFGYSFPGLSKLFEEVGLLRVEEDVLSTDRLPEQRGEFTDLGIGAVFGGLRNLAKVEGQGYWDEVEVERRRALAVRDRESGAYLRWDIHVGVGFKA